MPSLLNVLKKTERDMTTASNGTSRTEFAISVDGTSIAYEVNGNGPAVVLLHGSFQNRHVWSSIGYTDRLKSDNRVITIDLRGHGDSDRPIESAAYTIDKLCQDVLAVSDACAVDRFAVWGYSGGGNVARYLGSRSKRVEKLALLGVEFGPGAPERLRARVVSAVKHWTPIWQLQREGKLDAQTLSPQDQQTLGAGLLPSSIALANAAFEWPVNNPADLLCPTLWLIGTKHEPCMANVDEYRSALERTNVTLQLLEGLDHQQELTEINQGFPSMQAFTRS
jgi:pimeloyl-ACP methyl ester carboxylesterase